MFAVIYDEYGNLYDAKCVAAFATREAAASFMRERVLEECIENTTVEIRWEEGDEGEPVYENGKRVADRVDVEFNFSWDEIGISSGDMIFSPTGFEGAAYKIIEILEA